MNYRHAFHAGNFADLLKHAVVLALIDRLSGAGPLQVIDTHAGAGGYDLMGASALKSGEAQAGIVRLLADPSAPAAFDRLKSAIARANPQGPVRIYPGSPLLAAGALRPGDRYLGCELRADDHAMLAQSLKPFSNAQARLADGFQAAAAALDRRFRNLVLIDPPFEAADDYARIAAATAAVLARQSDAVMAIWVPLKDLETFDALLRRLEAAGAASILIAEARLRPLSDPMKMNGCAMLMINPPEGLEDGLEDVVQWVAASHGDPGARGAVWRISG